MILIVKKPSHLAKVCRLINFHQNFSINILFFVISYKGLNLISHVHYQSVFLHIPIKYYQNKLKNVKMKLQQNVHLHRPKFDHKKNNHAWMNFKRPGEKNAKKLWPFMTSCQENKNFLAERPDSKAKYWWMDTPSPIFNMIQWISALARLLEIM